MRLDSGKLRAKVDELGLTEAQLAEALESGSGRSTKDSGKAVRNWMAGRDHPRCKASDIKALAVGVGVEPKEIARFTSMVRHHRGSPRKAKLVVDLIRGRHGEEAMTLLKFSPKRAATNVYKALDAAITEAGENGADLSRCVVTEARVDNGKHIKRFRPKDRGRAHPILKRTSHITVSVQEIA